MHVLAGEPLFRHCSHILLTYNMLMCFWLQLEQTIDPKDSRISVPWDSATSSAKSSPVRSASSSADKHWFLSLAPYEVICKSPVLAKNVATKLFKKKKNLGNKTMWFSEPFSSPCMSAVSRIWAAPYTAPATGVLTSRNQRICESWHVLHKIICHKQIQNGCLSLWWSILFSYGPICLTTTCANKRTPYKKTRPALPWQYLSTGVNLPSQGELAVGGHPTSKFLFRAKPKTCIWKAGLVQIRPRLALPQLRTAKPGAFTNLMHLQRLASHMHIES